jgi:3-oxoacyl-[acyl-carrier-protein] synthase-3
MGIQAAKEALANARLEGKDIDVVIYSVGFIPDYLGWADHAYVQNELGIINAFSFSVYQGCNSAILGLMMAHSLLLSNNYKNVLLVMAERWNDNIINRWNTSPFCFYGDGAGAAVMTNTDMEAEISIEVLSSHFFTDGYYSMMNYIECGGNVCPPSIDAVNAGKHIADNRVIDKFWVGKEDKKEDFFINFIETQLSVLKEAVRKANLKLEQISHLVYYNLSAEIYRIIFRLLKFDFEKTSAYLAKEHGHMGVADIYINLKKELDAGRIKKGNIIGLVSAGIGYTWAASIVKILE